MVLYQKIKILLSLTIRMDNLEFLNILLLFKCILELLVEVIALFFCLSYLLLVHFYYEDISFINQNT